MSTGLEARSSGFGVLPYGRDTVDPVVPGERGDKAEGRASGLFLFFFFF